MLITNDEEELRRSLTLTESAIPERISADPEIVESAVAEAKRHNWRKQPDVPLKEALLLRRSRKTRPGTER